MAIKQKKVPKNSYTRDKDNAMKKKDFNARSKRRGFKTKSQRDVAKNQFVDKMQKNKRAKNTAQVKEEADVSDIEMNSGDSEEEQVDPVDREQENFKQTGELDLPGDDTSEEEPEEEVVMEQSGDDSELENYYMELGIDEEDAVKGRKKKHAKKEEKPDHPSHGEIDEPMYEKKPKVTKEKRKKSEVVEGMLEKARTESSYKTLTNVISLIKTVFSATKDVEPEDKEEDEKKKKGAKQPAPKQVFQKALASSEEYVALLKFFGGELPKILVELCQKKLGKVNQQFFQVLKLPQKLQILLKSFSSLYCSLLGQAILEDSHSSLLAFFFGESAAIAMCVSAYRLYHKKLAVRLGALVMDYTSQLDKPSTILAFNTLRGLFPRKMLLDADEGNETHSLFEQVLKKMHNEYTRVSKFGGGSLQVQDKLRISQNCFIEMLGMQRKTGYKLGFLYIRQLCLHLRQVRTNPTKDAIKNVYSWQFYNCMRLWSMAVTDAQSSELVLLVHPLVQLITGVLKLNVNLKWFPFHQKCCELLITLNKKSGQFIPIAQHILAPFEEIKYLNSKPKPLQDKFIPETLVSLKIAKKHFETAEMKDRIIRETVETLTLFFAANGTALSFPELLVAPMVQLRKFRKQCSNNGYRKVVANLLEILQRNEAWMAKERAQIADKSMKDPAKLHQQFATMIQAKTAPIAAEGKKITTARENAVRMRLNAKK